MRVVPIAGTAVDWKSLLTLARQALGRPLTAHLDAARVGLDSPGAWVAALGGLRREGDKPERILRDAGPLLKHGFQSFLLVLSDAALSAVLEDSAVAVTSGEAVVRGARVAVASGTYEQWRTTVINCCSEESDYEVRAVFCEVLSAFERMGLGPLWHDFARKSLPDSTLALEPRHQP